jgi:hypothetical protein
MKLSEQKLQKQIGYLDSSGKNTEFRKQIVQNRSLGSEVIDILNSTIFWGFFGNNHVICKVSDFL